jgi:hypothetical protein
VQQSSSRSRLISTTPRPRLRRNPWAVATRGRQSRTATHPRQQHSRAGRRTHFGSTANRSVTRAPSSHGGQGQSRHTSTAGHRARAASTCRAHRALIRQPATTRMRSARPGSTVEHPTRPRATQVTKLPPETWPGRGLPAPGAPPWPPLPVAGAARSPRTRLRMRWQQRGTPEAAS